MAGESATKQISGHRFVLRRMEHALVRGDVRMLDDPMRAQSLSLLAGCVLAVIAVGACAMLAFLAPKGTIGDAAIVMVRDSGALYVRNGDTLHPVLNLASARLIAGTSAKPELVSASAVDKVRRGPLLGIPGAPDVIATPLAESRWTVCQDATSKTTVIAGGIPQRLDTGRGALVTVPQEGAAMTYFLYDGRRARVDLRNPAVIRALKLDGVEPQPVSRALLDILPETAPIAAPHIPEPPRTSAVPGFPIGTVLRVLRAGSSEYYVALADGVQRIGEVAADLIRFTRKHGSRDIITVAPGVIGSVPIVDDDLPVGSYPSRGGVSDDPVLCGHWDMSTRVLETAVLTGASLPVDSEGVTLAQADDAGPAVDIVVVPRGHSAFVRATGVTGDGADSGTLFLVDDTGVAFGISDDDAAERLGLTQTARPAPWPVLARLPRGPALSVQAASVVRVGATS
ncbi:type VII secretion protein EccB [Mycobacterium deserti]|uniref:Type VII secretion protein EccB n=1 Tax=Mycobacterium deserti TaxID=2978347 RepID=A0ABT2M936_9MYCO|nr:type VII secretion protein EccB [Mycobacterium deserti]MCT7658119.1 type VII secretion protein EccB [Mycobacterium deserti]